MSGSVRLRSGLLFVLAVLSGVWSANIYAAIILPFVAARTAVSH